MTQPQAPVEPAPAPKQETRAIVRVGFPFGAAALNSAAKKTIDTMAATLATGTSAVSITGHADSKGPVDVNRRVALARAHAVANRLLHDGVSAQRLRVDSAGADAPVASNNLDAGRAENRRVDIELIPQ